MNYAPLSSRTLFRILSEACVASVRKSLQGLDSYAAEGGRGFDDLLSSAMPRHRFNSKQRRYLEEKFKHGETKGIKANPDDVSKEMRWDQSGKRIFTVKEFLRPQQITSFFSRMACKRRDATDSDDEAEEFARQQAAVHSDVMEVLRQEITHPLLFSGKNLCLMTESEIESLKITQMRSIVSHFCIKVKARKKNVYSIAIIEFLKRCSCKQ